MDPRRSTTDIPPPQSAALCLQPVARRLLLINRPRRDGTLSWRWYTAAPAGSRSHDLAIASPAPYHSATAYASRQRPEEKGCLARVHAGLIANLHAQTRQKNQCITVESIRHARLKGKRLNDVWVCKLTYFVSFLSFASRIPAEMIDSKCPDVKNYSWRLNPVWHRMQLCSCIPYGDSGHQRVNTLGSKDHES